MIRSFLQNDPKVAWLLVGGLVGALVHLARIVWRRWLEHEEEKYRAQRRQRIEAAATIQIPPSAIEINYPPKKVGEHRTPWRDTRRAS